ncbi:hypothetical protein ABPG74_017675 [Tetrahymena malaccensis]
MNQLSMGEQIQDPHQYLVNITASCLLKESSYYKDSDQKRILITQALLKVAEIDPEFICQLSVYIRNELYIRSTTNYIVSFCVVNEKTKPFIEKYFNKAVLLPGDLLEVCEFAQILYQFDQAKYEDLSLDNILQTDIRKKLTFNKCLQRCVRSKFFEFNDYQLGKYCTDSQRKKTDLRYLSVNDVQKWEKIQQKKKNNKIKSSIQQEKDFLYDDEEQQEQDRLFGIQKSIAKREKAVQNHHKRPKIPKSILESEYLTFKHLIQLCHITQPKERVFKILGKKYPKTEEEYKSTFGESASAPFALEQADQRMKIEVSTTWENELSAKGNTKEVWENLIQNQKLPYMAMMRNLSNILKSGVSDITHSIIINKISDPKAVENSKMFPLQFFSAIEAVKEAVQKGFMCWKQRNMNLKEELEAVKQHVERSEQKQASSYLEAYQIKEFLKLDPYMGQLYINSIEQAIKVSVNKNLDELKGHTVIFTDVSGSMQCPISGGKNYGSIRTCCECASVLGLMIKQKCEKNSFYIFSSPGYNNKCYLKVDLPGDELGSSMQKLLTEAQKLGGGTDFPYECIDEWTQKKIYVDNIVILSDMMIANGYSDIRQGQNSVLNSIKNYKNEVNPNLKIFAVDLQGYGKYFNLGDEFNENNYIKIFGMSDSILKFISVKQGGVNQIDYIKQFALLKISQQ